MTKWWALAIITWIAVVVMATHVLVTAFEFPPPTQTTFELKTDKEAP
jgi:hypothetical protein